jgi:hypothetical protein
MSLITRFDDMQACQEARKLVKMTYELTFLLTPPSRRCRVAVPAARTALGALLKK